HTRFSRDWSSDVCSSDLLSVGLRKTRWGAMIRAATGDPLMAASLGVPTERVFFWTFVFGAMLAGFGGVLGAPMIALAPGLDFTKIGRASCREGGLVSGLR